MITDYKEDIDVLTVEREDYDDYSESIEMGGFVLDIDSESGFLGLEIIDASQKTSMTREELRNIKDVELEMEKDKDYFRVQLRLKSEKGESRITSQYPRPAAA
ncbi:MAG: hypothetical protein ABEI58_01495 [Candidatus Nanohaloarchaea archaeon]